MLLLMLLVLHVVYGGADAQILNTLRGWAEPDEGWSLEVDGKLSYAKGNSDHLHITAGAMVQYETGRNRFRFLISDNFQSTDDERTASDFKLHLRHNYRFSETLSSLLFAQNEYNPYKRLERRTLLGAGARADLIRSSSCQAALGASLMLESIELTDDPNAGTSNETRGSFFGSFIYQPAYSIQIDLSGFYQPLLPDFNDPLILAELCLQTSITDKLAITTSMEYSFNGNPPKDVKDTDVEITSGLRVLL